MAFKRIALASRTAILRLRPRVPALILIAAILQFTFPVYVQAETGAPIENRAALLPMLSAGPIVNAEQVCTPNYEEALLLEYMLTDEEQTREELNCNPTLSEVARARAQDMAERSYFDHVNPDGYGPNYLVRQAGFELPSWYPDSPSANNVESIGAHFATAANVWEAWTNADGHRMHVLGTDAFFAEQVEVGIGYYYDEASHYKAYWVLITAPPEPE